MKPDPGAPRPEDDPEDAVPEPDRYSGDLPLGDPSARVAWTVMANVLGGEPTDLYPTYRHLMARDPGLRLHLYGKGVRPGRKIGHATVFGDDLASLRDRARHAADYIEGVIDE